MWLKIKAFLLCVFRKVFVVQVLPDLFARCRGLRWEERRRCNPLFYSSHPSDSSHLPSAAFACSNSGQNSQSYRAVE